MKGTTANERTTYTSLVEHPVVHKLKQVAREWRDALSSGFQSGKGDESKAKWWLLFGIVFVFTSVLFLQNGASNSGLNMDRAAAIRIQEARLEAKKHAADLDKLRRKVKICKDENRVYVSDISQLKIDMKSMEDIIANKSKTNKELEQELGESFGSNTEIQQAVGKLNSQIQEQAETIDQRNSDIVQLNSDIDQLNSDLEVARTKSNAYKTILETKVRELEDIQVKMKSFKKVSDLQEKLIESFKRSCTNAAPTGGGSDDTSDAGGDAGGDDG
ncbi:hypothetical protein A3770_03p21770 [Chloropicon primus]|uniref:Uncharacterized protein n=1 Tax=Chloropicon primus TaxID=1764295 RepID=A0A5B8MGW2_9CHLO|nr:hypothetical protein A3770_03p21770 [Chloropicon primus]|eukprot:QDZ19659.1 hypothetical protein A3770_03p21770 [Chloropicon primus]